MLTTTVDERIKTDKINDFSHQHLLKTQRLFLNIIIISFTFLWLNHSLLTEEY